jgi:hypothetical protein
MTTHLNSTLPERQPKRALMFSIRLTEAELGEIDALAQRLKLPSSFMARHFILEAVKHHKNHIIREAAIEA